MNKPDFPKVCRGREKPMFSNFIGEGVTSHHWTVPGKVERGGKFGCCGVPSGSSYTRRINNSAIGYDKSYLDARSLYPPPDTFLEYYTSTLRSGAKQIKFVDWVSRTRTINVQPPTGLKAHEWKFDQPPRRDPIFWPLQDFKYINWWRYIPLNRLFRCFNLIFSW